MNVLRVPVDNTRNDLVTRHSSRSNNERDTKEESEIGPKIGATILSNSYSKKDSERTVTYVYNKKCSINTAKDCKHRN